ncbi:MAG: hypothetical protein HC890_12910 [Chloroflexaceae bacterium]|nr:hypothetical protein [Chloroflexaceae bacterium]
MEWQAVHLFQIGNSQQAARFLQSLDCNLRQARAKFDMSANIQQATLSEVLLKAITQI